MEIKEELVQIRNKEGEYLFGDITFPENAQEKNPAVLLVHGFGVERNESGLFSDVASKLSNIGYLVFKFDFSGCGDSDGDYSETSLSKLKSDLETILDEIKRSYKVDKNRIGIVAQSFGTSVAVALKPDVKAMVLMGSIAHPYEILKGAFKENFDPNGISLLKRSNGNFTKVKPRFWQDLKEYDLLKDIKKIPYPILFIHGKEDKKVPLLEMWDFYYAKRGGKARDIEKGAGHDLKPKRENVYLLIEDWFNKYLKG